MQRADVIKSIEQTIQNLNDKGLEIVAGAFVGLENVEKYSIHTTKERLEQIKAEEEQKVAEERARKERAYIMADSGKVFEKLVHLATLKDIIVRFAPLKASCGRLKGNRIAIKQDLPSIDDYNFTLAHELAHAYLHYDKGDLMNSSECGAYEEQADRTAKLILDLLTE